MDEHKTFEIELGGRLSEDDLNEFSPIQMQLVRADADSTTFLVHTDASGLVGLIRCLHGRGLALQSINLERSVE